MRAEPGLNLASALVESLSTNPRLVLDFFAVFSRFEYALKRSGFLAAGEIAKPNWRKFEDEMRNRFAELDDASFQRAVQSLLYAPPDTQTVRDGDLSWTATRQGDDHHERYILRLVRTVRNNLFHGGKFPSPVASVDDLARNEALLDAAITVLSGCLRLNDTIRASFDETP